MAYPYNREVEVDHAAQARCLEFSPNGRMKKGNKKNDC